MIEVVNAALQGPGQKAMLLIIIVWGLDVSSYNFDCAGQFETAILISVLFIFLRKKNVKKWYILCKRERLYLDFFPSESYIN